MLDTPFPDLYGEIATATCQLGRSADLPGVGDELARLLRHHSVGFGALSVHLIDPKQGKGRFYHLCPGPSRWVDQEVTSAAAPLQVHLEQRARMWQGGESQWCLVLPTTLGAVEVVDSRTTAFGLSEQELWSSLAPSLQLLALRHRDLERLEGLSEAAVAPPAARRPDPARTPTGPDAFADVVACSAAMRGVIELARLSATTDYSVLILGESGTGKDLLAHAIHAHSRRRGGPLVVVNSARLATGIEDSELFGHVKGAFTGAAQDAGGLVAAAHQGTLFLDEIGDLASTSQAKMLRCLETGEVRRVGDTHAHRVDIRLIAATNRDLRHAVAEGSFRDDLFYRLAIITIAIPPLRERPDDIPPLAMRFLRRISAESAQPVDITPAALDLLVGSPWPGNARQLDSCLRHAALLARAGRIGEEHLPEELRLLPAAAGAGVLGSLAEMERRHILQVLERCGRDRQEARRILGISRATLQRRLSEYGISP